MSRKQSENKKYQEELEAAKVFEEFIEEFQNPKSVEKIWVKEGYKQQCGENDTLNSPSTNVYKPSPIFKSNQDKVSVEKAKECARILSKDTKHEYKRKSNLESFKEELELLHKDRAEKLNNNVQINTISQSEFNLPSDTCDPKSTNLFVNNLSPNIIECHLMEIFGQYGPLASVKIMWPRSEDNKRNKHCGFVAFMSRKDAERALKEINGKHIMENELKICWGKRIPLPRFPVYIPAVLLELFNPPPITGLPFNAQPPKYVPKSAKTFDEFLSYCTVKVVIPTERNNLFLIHRTIEFVLREGALFEAILMTREISNASFKFLFDNRSPEHIYYRWKLYSIMHGDCTNEWNTKEFRMFKGGPIWQPPIIPDYTIGMPEALVNRKEKQFELLKQFLSTRQRNQLETLIQKLTPEKNAISEALIFCLQHCAAFDEIVKCIVQSLEKKSTSLQKIISRLYLISDILYNGTVNKRFSCFVKAFETYLPNIMEVLSEDFAILANEQKQLFFVKIIRIFNAWQYNHIYPEQFLQFLYRIFINFEATKNIISDVKSNVDVASNDNINNIVRDDLHIQTDELKESNKIPGFISSKWETLDPDTIESEAMTTSKWSQIQDDTKNGKESTHKCIQTRSISEDKRRKLREIEVKVMEYQVDIESGIERLKANMTLEEQLAKYRKKLIKQLEKKLEDENKSSKKSQNSSNSKRNRTQK